MSCIRYVNIKIRLHSEVKHWCLLTSAKLHLASNLPKKKLNNWNLKSLFDCLRLFAGGLWSFAAGLWWFDRHCRERNLLFGVGIDYQYVCTICITKVREKILHFGKIITCFAKVYSMNNFAIEIQKHGMEFPIIFCY